MADQLTAGGVTVYRNSAGALVDSPALSATGGTAGGTLDPNVTFKVAQPDSTNSDTLDLSQVDNAIVIPLNNGQGVLGLDFEGLTGSGATIVCEMRLGSIWRPANMLLNGSQGNPTQSATVDATGRANTVGRNATRFRVSVAGTGTATVSWAATANSSMILLASSLPTGANVIGGVTISGTAQVAGTVSIAPNTSVAVSNFPAGFQVAGTVNVGNFPASQAVTGTFWQATQPVSIAATVQVADSGGSLTVDTGTAGTFNVTSYRAPNSAAIGALTPKTATGASAFIASAVPCNFFGAAVISTPNGSAAYVFILNRTTIPASGSAIDMSQVLGMTGYSAGGGASIVPDQVPDRFSAGCVVIVSSSQDTYTPLTGANLPKYIKVRVL